MEQVARCGHRPVVRIAASSANKPQTSSAALSIRIRCVLGWISRHKKAQSAPIRHIRIIKVVTFASIGPL